MDFSVENLEWQMGAADFMVDFPQKEGITGIIRERAAPRRSDRGRLKKTLISDSWSWRP